MNLLKRWRVVLLGVVVSALAIYFIVSEIDLNLLGDAVRAAEWVYVIPCVALLLLGLVARGLRWRMLLSGGLRFKRAFHIMNVAYLVNGVLPLRIGEVARMFLATRAEPPVPVLKTASTIVVERLLDLLAVVLMVAFALALGPVPDRLQSAGLFTGVVALGGFLTLVVLARWRDLAHRIVGAISARVPLLRRWNVEVLLDDLLDGLLPLAKVSTLAQALIWTAICWSISVAAGYVLMYTFYDTASLPATFLFIAAAAFAIAVAPQAAVGVYEGAIIVALDALGYGEPAATALAFAVTVHFVNVAVHAVTGVIGFIAEGVTWGQLSDGVRSVQATPHTEASKG